VVQERVVDHAYDRLTTYCESDRSATVRVAVYEVGGTVDRTV
jgi:hypothetical protein